MRFFEWPAVQSTFVDRVVPLCYRCSASWKFDSARTDFAERWPAVTEGDLDPALPGSHQIRSGVADQHVS